MPKTSVQARAQNGKDGANAFYDQPIMGAINPLTFFTINMAGYADSGLPAWSYYPQVRDYYLRVLSRNEPIMASVIYSITSRVKSLPWEIVKGGRRDKKYYQSLYAEADGGAGYGTFVSKVVTDLLTQDNGAFIELVGAGREDRPLVGRVRELWHMDSAQCWRTFDKEYPVIYVDPMNNTYHRMHASRVMMLSSFPQSDERARNIGFCAVSRALRLMQTMRNIQIFRDEKVTGKFNRGLIYGSGFTVKQFDEAVERSEQIAEAMNFAVYKDIPVMLSMMQDVKMDVLNLASLPDGFDWEKELTLYAYSLAVAFGTDAREFWPATASGATKADATVQHLKAQGKGTADIIKSLETGFNWHVQPQSGRLPFEYDFQDDEQDKAVAELQGIKADNIIKYQNAGWIDAFEGRALAIHEGLFDPKVLAVVVTPESAGDASPIDDDEDMELIERPAAEEADPDAVDEFEFDPTQAGAKAGFVKFDENKHDRASDGKFGSGGGTETDRQGNQIGTSPGGMKFKLTPLADRLKAFLGILNQAGSYKDGKLLIKRTKHDRSADLKKYLRNKGFPNAEVSMQRTGKGVEYTINTNGGGPTASTAKPKRKRRKKQDSEGKLDALVMKKAVFSKKKAVLIARKDTTLEQYIAEYQAALNDLYDQFIDNVLDSGLDEALDDLYDDFLNNMPTFLTTGFGVGLQGSAPTDTGINRLEQLGQLSADFFSDSFIIALAALGVSGLESGGIRALLETLRARFMMYAGAMWTAIWEGARDATDSALRVRRVLEEGAAHCEVCPDFAREYESYDIMVAEVGLPGENTPCLTNCRCSIEVETVPGSGVFVSLTGDPTVFVRPLFEVLRKERAA